MGRRVPLLLLGLVACGSTARAAGTEPPTIRVRVVGSGPPMVLVPGLACSDAVWRSLEPRLQRDHELHLVTLPGFAGQPPAAGPVIARARRELAAYLRERRLERPILVGHSLGATVVLGLAGDEPRRTGAVIALDGAPFGAALADPEATPERVRPRADALRARVAAISPDQLASQAALMFRPMVTDPRDMEWILPMVLASDVATVADAMHELMTTDLRGHTRNITSPVLLLVADEHLDGPDDLAVYRAQLQAQGPVRVEAIERSRHFVMLDQPALVEAAIRRFLAAAAP